MPKKYEEVKVVFNNGTLVEGLVLDWYDNYGTIYTKSGDIIEIYNISSNVLFVKTIQPELDKDPQLDAYRNGVPYVPLQEPGENPVDDECEVTSRLNPRTRAASIAELKVQKNIELRKSLAARIKSNRVPTTIQTSYEYPDFTKFSPV